MKLETVQLNQVAESENLRKEGWEKDISELTKSIKAIGLLQPPILLKKGNTYTVIVGARRVAACKQLQMKTISALVVEEKDTKDIWQKKLAENITRKNLEPLEEAAIFHKLKSELKMTSKLIAEALGVTEGYVSQRMQLLKLPEEIQNALREHQIEFAHARELARVEDPNEQLRLLKVAQNTTPDKFLEKLQGTKKRETKRGRPAKQTPRAVARTVSEIKKAAAEVDKARTEAIEQGNQLREEFFKGMLRALGWAGGMVDKLM